MKAELRLDTLREVKDLLLCPMKHEQYNGKLRSKGLFDQKNDTLSMRH
jgi:hypothetical protein